MIADRDVGVPCEQLPIPSLAGQAVVNLKSGACDDHCAHWLSATLQPRNTRISWTSKEVQLPAATDGWRYTSSSQPSLRQLQTSREGWPKARCRSTPLSQSHKILDTTPTRVLLPTDLQV
jgi:hypothetical protein